MTNDEKAFEELKIFQKSISDHDAAFNKIRGWSITLISAISVGYLSDRLAISKLDYLSLSLMIVLFFSWSEAIHRVAQSRATKRTGEIERAIRGEIEYTGPFIRKTFKQGNSFSDQVVAVRKPRFYVTYLSLVVIILIVSVGR